MRIIAQKCNLQLLPLPGMLQPVNATGFCQLFSIYSKLQTSPQGTDCISSAEAASPLVQVLLCAKACL